MKRTRQKETTAWARLLPLLLFVPLMIIAAIFALRVFAPIPKLPAISPLQNYEEGPMLAAVSPERVKEEHQRILSFGSRFLGQDGVRKTEEYIRSRFQQAGLEVYEQPIRTATPQTLTREILVEEPAGSGDFQKIDSVEVYPFWPNHMQPMVTPPDGLTGELVLVTNETLQTRPSFDGCIGLINCRAIPGSCEYDWAAYAALGLSAIIIGDPAGLESVAWPQVTGNPNRPAAGSINGSVPVNYVRLAATPRIFDYAGRRIKLNVKTQWANVRSTTLCGILRAPKPSREAVSIVSCYDACAILPDLAPGTLQAYEPAIQLCLLDGLLPYRDTLQRDIIFVATTGRFMSEDGAKNLIRVLGISQMGTQENRLLAALGFGASEGADRLEFRARSRLEGRTKPLLERLHRHQYCLDMLKKISGAFADSAFFAEPDATATAAADFDAGAEAFFEEQYRYVLNTIMLELSEKTLQAKLAYERKEIKDLQGPEFQAYLRAKRDYDEAQSAAGFAAVSLLRGKREYVQKQAVRRRMIERLQELTAYDSEMQDALTKEIAIAQALNPYDEMVFLLPGFVPAFDEKDAQESVSFAGGTYLIQSPERIFESLLASSQQRVARDSLKIPKVDRWHDNAVWREIGKSPYGASDCFREFGYQSFRLINFGRSRSYDYSCVPVDVAFMHDADSMRQSLALAGDVVLSMGHGAAKFPGTIGYKFDVAGRVLISNIGQSIVPNYPLKNALLGTRSRLNPQQYSAPGYYETPFAFADVYGKFDLFNCGAGNRTFLNIMLSKIDGKGFSPLACGYGTDGVIAYMKDEGEDGQRLYKSAGLLWNDTVRFKDLTIVTFRSSPVTLLDLENPQTNELYGWAELVNRDGMAALRKQCILSVKAPYVAFVEPDKRFCVKLQAGTVENKLALVTRAFMLGPTAGSLVDAGKEIDGMGYLAADAGILKKLPTEISKSMLFLNGKRLALLNEHSMADDRANQYHEKAQALLASSEDGGKPLRASRQEARDAVTYNELNHPVLRAKISEAVIGILWYLGLLAPFCFFFEKLVFAYADVRKQIAVQMTTFLVVFGLLRLLHPAFQMVQSSLMILLGFIIILISAGITVLFSAAFKESLEELKKRQGKVSAAEVNMLGVIGTAFLLGLNNMHRRRVRTSLTCGTLVLMTFVVICFTSVQNDIVEETIAITKAPYQGILVKKKDFEPLMTVSGLINEYGSRYELCEREMYLGEQYMGQSYNPTLQISYEPQGGPARTVAIDSVVKLAAAEPMQTQIEFKGSTRWFTPEQERNGGDMCPVLLPDVLAQKLGVDPARAGQADCVVSINGRRFVVQGIFTAESYDNARDLDGLPVLPYDIEAMSNVGSLATNIYLAKDTDPRIPAERIVLCPAKRDLQIQLQHGALHRVSLAISMPKATYKEAKAQIDSYLERKAEAVFYGLGGAAFRGKRTRETTFAGMLDLLLPLSIAAFTVLNTMKGSVYERRDEIFVYNAVGIAPRLVFFIFFAEAAVYAVVGSVLGYIFSQGVGRIVNDFGLAQGLNMSFTSMTCIYASIAIGATVMISTYFPARTAMQISAPADDAGWRMPEPDGDVLRFHLPFMFNTCDRIAILAFFHRYLSDHGEGSAGRFFSSPPEIGVTEQDNALVPQISSTLWLKPFDLAVSQEMSLSAPTDKETGEYVAELRLTRISGTKGAWLRLNVSFLRLVREHLLHWRAVSDEERHEMFLEAKEIMETTLLSASTADSVQFAEQAISDGLENGGTKTSQGS